MYLNNQGQTLRAKFPASYNPTLKLAHTGVPVTPAKNFPETENLLTLFTKALNLLHKAGHCSSDVRSTPWE
ncbi:hypothetical protein Y1Q_0002386 [Alligator mississippiensis]|uniref:Uncharacterized protein n=1 Tax=Alligator mississippiensis TaxID=8496 RepID=A0A151MGX1_ALLMI|nr:hypothetical protein Y1Q_0002386 [Alligator mississippiensis]